MMPEMILYLLKVNVALVLFYAGYHFILQRYTFHSINRFYLLIGLVYSAVYPLINLSEILNGNEQLKDKIGMIAPDWEGSVAAVLNAEDSASYYWQIALTVFWTGVVIMTLRLIIQLASLFVLHLQSVAITSGKIKFRKISKAVNPFSFWRTIYLNPECHSAGELKSILEHEQVHVRQLHTFDVMLAEISTIFYWFNPGVWLMKNAIKANLEFITDQEVIKSGIDSKEYQYTLLKTQVLPQNQMPVNNFHFLTIKRRIAMINKKPSNRINLSNYFLLLPAIMLLVLIAGISKADFTRNDVLNAIIHIPGTPLERVLPIEEQTSQGEVNTEEQIKVSNLSEPDTIKKKNAEVSRITIRETSSKENIDGELAKGTSPATIILKSGIQKSTTDPQPLYVVDGQAMEGGVKDLEPNTIASINVYKGEAAIAQYGEKGKNGVVEIRTKLAGSGQNTGGVKPKVATGEGSNQNQSVSVKIDKQLIILDGIEITKAEMDQIDSKNISSVNVIKGKPAIDQYGLKGENGVIVITTKE